MILQEKIFKIIEPAKNDSLTDKKYDFYDTIMLFIIILSIIPLMFKEFHPLFIVIDTICFAMFIIDYLFRWFTANLKLKRGLKSFLMYPFTPFAIIDLISILPYLNVLRASFKLLRIFRLLRTLRVLKVLRYSNHFETIINVLNKRKSLLISILVFTLGYIFVSALVMFNVETEDFNNFFEAIYWSTISLTTVGYGDIHPMSEEGRFVSMVSSLVGIAIVALPTGIITAGFIEELKDEGEKEKEKEKDENP